jgi:hypothetical protein
MIRTGVVYWMVGFVVLCAVASGNAQTFPYSAPQAPEFDQNGNPMPPGRGEIVQPDPQAGPQPQQNIAPRDQPDYRAVRPYAPQEQPAPNANPRRSKRQANQGQYMPPNRAAPASAAPPPQPQAGVRPDCSQFPMLIARSQSEAEMQMTAKRYLACLIQNGWQPDQAKQQVIATIESTFRAPQ